MFGVRNPQTAATHGPSDLDWRSHRNVRCLLERWDPRAEVLHRRPSANQVGLLVIGKGAESLNLRLIEVRIKRSSDGFIRK